MEVEVVSGEARDTAHPMEIFVAPDTERHPVRHLQAEIGVSSVGLKVVGVHVPAGTAGLTGEAVTLEDRSRPCFVLAAARCVSFAFGDVGPPAVVAFAAVCGDLQAAAGPGMPAAQETGKHGGFIPAIAHAKPPSARCGAGFANCNQLPETEPRQIELRLGERPAHDRRAFIPKTPAGPSSPPFQEFPSDNRAFPAGAGTPPHGFPTCRGPPFDYRKPTEYLPRQFQRTHYSTVSRSISASKSPSPSGSGPAAAFFPPGTTSRGPTILSAKPREAEGPVAVMMPAP